MIVRALTPHDRDWLRTVLREGWGGERMVGAGRVFSPAEHDGFVAGDRAGVITFRIEHGACEVTMIEAFPPGRGAGTALLDAVVEAARSRGATRIWLVTTNDNVHAQAWYGRRGFRVVAVRPGAVDEARRTLKPTISLVNEQTGLPIRDEIEMELPL
jgi:ribosomal protein S18 acetylase RimI-like enzyme